MNEKQFSKLQKSVQAMPLDDKIKLVQAMSGTEGVTFEVAMSSLLDGEPINKTGYDRLYKTYSSQVINTHKKYKGFSDYGCAQVRCIVDIRTAFISAEGISIIPGSKISKKQIDFIDNFIKLNKLDAGRLFDIVRQTEMNGYSVPYLIPSRKDEDTPRILLFPFNGTSTIKPHYRMEHDTYSVDRIMIKSRDSGDYRESSIKTFVFIRTGGTADDLYDLTTKVGLVLNECDNYDKAVRDLRVLNAKCSRITPTWETQGKQETDTVVKWLKENHWKVGDGFVGTAKFKYNSSDNMPVKNLQDEMAINSKIIASTTGIPIHWMGWVDLMSNRATAEELYNVINNATIEERTIISDGIKSLLILAQKMHINSGGEKINEFSDDFKVDLPLIDLGRFKDMVTAYHQLYEDEIISQKSYMNAVPGIDPIFEAKQIEAERKANEKLMAKKVDMNKTLNGEEEDKEETDQEEKDE
ncbi:MAG: hypothetical protein A4E71_02651 [Smithella sp. PtaU1.Bin162]|nr:MAG: hypothetical protein A4E71_02651 [Smithella sp. PtaU1.Bin162]